MPLIWRMRRPVPWLAWIGQSAYSVYLFHVFGAAGGRIGLQAAGITSRPALCFGSLACGLLAPIALERVLTRWAATRKYVLGMKA